MAALCAEFGISRKTGYKIYGPQPVAELDLGLALLVRPEERDRFRGELHRSRAFHLGRTVHCFQAPDVDMVRMDTDATSIWVENTFTVVPLKRSLATATD